MTKVDAHLATQAEAQTLSTAELFADLEKFVNKTDKNETKFIFMYWNDGFTNSPDIAKICYWFNKIQNPDRQIIFLDDKIISDVSSPVASLPQNIALKTKFAQTSDFVRMYFILKYGGAWVDASCLTTQPLMNWLDPILLNRDFYIQTTATFADRQIMSWFMAGCRGNTMLFDVANEWLTFVTRPGTEHLNLTFTPEKFCSPENIGPTTTGRAALSELETQGFFPYFFLHYLFNALYNEKDAFRQALDKMPKAPPALLKMDRRRFSGHNLVSQNESDGYSINADGVMNCEILPKGIREKILDHLANKPLLDPTTNLKDLPI